MNNNTIQAELNMTSSMPPVNRRKIKIQMQDELDRQRPLCTDWTGRSRDYPRIYRPVTLP